MITSQWHIGPALLGALWWLAASATAHAQSAPSPDSTDGGVRWFQSREPFAPLIADPLETVRRIYAHYDQEPSPLHEKRMQAWIDSRGQTSFGRHVYDPVDFGWSYDGLAEQYASYRERYDVDREAV